MKRKSGGHIASGIRKANLNLLQKLLLFHNFQHSLCKIFEVNKITSAVRRDELANTEEFMKAFPYISGVIVLLCQSEQG